MLKLKPAQFRWKANPDRQIAGFIAQDVQEQIPEATYTVPNSQYFGFESTAVLSYVVRALQEFYHRYERDSKALETRVETLEQENQQLREALCAQNPALKFCR